MEKLLDFLKNINNWNRVAQIATILALLSLTYYVIAEIDRYDKFQSMNPWEYFSKQEIRDIDGLNELVSSSREELDAAIVAVYMYQPKELKFYRTLTAISPSGVYADYVKSEQRVQLYNMPTLLTDLRDAGISVITMNSGHYDSKMLIALQCDVAYVMKISINGIDVGHIMFVFKKAPTDIPWVAMKSVTERVKLKIF